MGLLYPPSFLPLPSSQPRDLNAAAAVATQTFHRPHKLKHREGEKERLRESKYAKSAGGDDTNGRL